MARSPNPQDRVVGSFVEKEYGKTFDYALNPDQVFAPDPNTGRNVYFSHLVFVGPRGDETRLALVKGTVAYVVVDEFVIPDRGTFFRIEKWNIKKHVRYS